MPCAVEGARQCPQQQVSSTTSLSSVIFFFTLMLQGGWETDETAEEAAARETMEEAGVKGELQASLSHDRPHYPFPHLYARVRVRRKHAVAFGDKTRKKRAQ